MSESILSPEPEVAPSQEKFTPKFLFEHLFPGNKFESLPRTGTEALSVLLKLCLSERKKREANLIVTMAEGSVFAKREDPRQPDQLLMTYYLRGLIPIGKATHPTFYDSHSFSDLVDSNNGEKLGGVAERKFSPFNVGGRLVGTILRAPHDYRTETIFGVLNEKGEPIAFIYYNKGEVSGTKLPVKEKVSVGVTVAVGEQV